MKTFFSTILLAGSAIAAPTFTLTSRDDESCMAKGANVTGWTVHDFDFHSSYVFTTPAHQNSAGTVNFTLENSALDYRATCTATSSQLSDFFYGTMIYNCDVPARGDSASFTYNRASGELKINQTWNCREEGGRFSAQGNVTLDLDCKDSTWENPEWKMGQIYSDRTVTCEKKTVFAPITEISAVL